MRSEILVAANELYQPRVAKAPASGGRRAQMNALVALVPVGATHHLHEAVVSLRPGRVARAGLPLGLQEIQDHPVRHLEARLERLGRPRSEPLEGGPVPVDVSLRGRALLDDLLPGLLLLLEL